MNTWDWTPYLVGGATRPDAITGLDQGFSSALQQMFAAAPPDIQQQLRMLSGYRSVERQQQLWDEAVAKYGSPEAARRWVAPPGNSQHNHGNAVDLRYLDDSAREWAHANAANYGLHFPLAHEPWHIEPVSARSGGHSHTKGHGHAPQAAPQQPQTPAAPQMPMQGQQAPQPPQNALAQTPIWQPSRNALDPNALVTLDPSAFRFNRNALA